MTDVPVTNCATKSAHAVEHIYLYVGSLMIQQSILAHSIHSAIIIYNLGTTARKFYDNLPKHVINTVYYDPGGHYSIVSFLHVTFNLLLSPNCNH